jgi:hypothetical protein
MQDVTRKCPGDRRILGIREIQVPHLRRTDHPIFVRVAVFQEMQA